MEHLMTPIASPKCRPFPSVCEGGERASKEHYSAPSGMVAGCKGILFERNKTARASLEGEARVLSSMIVRPRTPPGVGPPCGRLVKAASREIDCVAIGGLGGWKKCGWPGG